MFIEENCSVELNGQTYTSGSAWLADCTDGKARGVVYVNESRGIVTDWHGNLIAYLTSFTTYRGNFCKMARIGFTYQGRKFTGDFCPSWSEACKVRTTKAHA